jgi:hypothetical protein
VRNLPISFNSLNDTFPGIKLTAADLDRCAGWQTILILRAGFRRWRLLRLRLRADHRAHPGDRPASRFLVAVSGIFGLGAGWHPGNISARMTVTIPKAHPSPQSVVSLSLMRHSSRGFRLPLPQLFSNFSAFGEIDADIFDIAFA